MGYDTDMFVVQPVKSHFMCIICNDVLENPVECTSCECMLCYDCFQLQSQKNSNKCPQCRKNLEIKKSSRNFVNLILELLVKCQACQEQFQLEKLDVHVKKLCKNQYITCTNKGCNLQILRKDLQDHIAKCELYSVTCQKCDCTYFANKSQEKEHGCINFLSKEVSSLKNDMVELKQQLNQFQVQINQLTKLVTQVQKQGSRNQTQNLQVTANQTVEADQSIVEESKVNWLLFQNINFDSLNSSKKIQFVNSEKRIRFQSEN